jgi:uncharacterized protein
VFQNVVASVLCYGWDFSLTARFADARPWWVIGLWLGPQHSLKWPTGVS